ncbi:MAG: adenylate/guanylate cyclase domain-containing protein [Nitrososphaerales archaeon]
MPQNDQRRLAAIMYTDMVGYTALGQRNESLSLALVDEQRKLLSPIFARHNGKVIKTMGDGFLVEFSSALEAVRCAYDIQRATREFNYSSPQEGKIHLRVGIHLGDIIESQGDISGDAVNVASRIESFAEDGGVCLTRQVYDQVHNKFDLPLGSLGMKPLKNVGGLVEVYKIVMPWNEEKSISPIPLDKRRIAVIPFVNISPDHSDEYFADGLTEELITKLSEIRGLRVIARTSAMSYKKKEKSILEIGRELGVGSVVEGSVRKSGKRIRVTVQLLDAQTEEHLWSSNYDKELDDIFAIQSDIASKVASSISTGIFPRPARKETDDVEAYTMYLKARQLYHEGTESSLRESIVLFDRAISRDPKFALAYAGLAHAWGRLASSGYEDFTTITSKAEPAAIKALEFGPDIAEAHAAMCNIAGFLDRFDQGVAEAEQAIKINPNLSETHISLGILYSTLRGLDDALQEFRRAYEIDPLFFATGTFVAMISRVAGKMNLSLDVLERMKEINPRNPRVYVSLAEWHMTNGDCTKAQEMLDIARQINSSEPSLLVNQGLLYALTGRKKEAEEVLQEVMGNNKEAVRLYGQLHIQAALGNLDGAFSALMRQIETHSWPFLIRFDPTFKELRKDPRFGQFCSKIGIPT